MTTFHSRATGSINTAQVRVKTLKEAGLKPGKPKGELTEEDLSHDGLRSFASCPEFKAAHNYWGNEWVVHRAELMTGGGWCTSASAKARSGLYARRFFATNCSLISILRHLQDLYTLALLQSQTTSTLLANIILMIFAQCVAA